MTNKLTYNQAVKHVFGLQRFGWKLGLERMTELLEALGNPQKDRRYIHIAGTNGKGSVAAMTEAVLLCAGYNTGLYTSPHLQDVRERFRYNGRLISESEFADHVNTMLPVSDALKCTFFEVMTALAFLYFQSVQADFVVLETGLGGRFDATNVVIPLVSVITTIGLEHTDYLGKDIASIAGEKAGIIKNNIPCVTGAMPAEAARVFEKTCDERNSLLYHADGLCNITNVQADYQGTRFDLMYDKNEKMSLFLPLSGSHQVKNSCTAVTAINVLRQSGIEITNEQICDGLAKVNWAGRFQIVCRDPLIVMDAAHNTDAFVQLCALLRDYFDDYEIIFVFGLLKDKNLEEIGNLIAKVAHEVIAVQVDNERSLEAVFVEQILHKKIDRVKSFISVKAGLKYAIGNYHKKQLLCVTGSHYVVGEALDEIKCLTT